MLNATGCKSSQADFRSLTAEHFTHKMQEALTDKLMCGLGFRALACVGFVLHRVANTRPEKHSFLPE